MKISDAGKYIIVMCSKNIKMGKNNFWVWRLTRHGHEVKRFRLIRAYKIRREIIDNCYLVMYNDDMSKTGWGGIIFKFED